MKRFIVLAFMIIGSVVTASEVGGEETEMMPPVMEGKERVCLDCHRCANVNTNEGVLDSRALCLECHGKEACKKEVKEHHISLMLTPDSFKGSRHQYVACIQCHTDVARSPHKFETGAQCLDCHPVHGGETANAPHLRVSCQACHRKSKFVVLDKNADRVRLSRVDDHKVPIPLTDHGLPDVSDQDFCKRCHNPRNQVGASSVVLPSKSFLCILCHNAPLVMGHGLFWAAFLIFIFGVFLTLRFWFKGSVQGEEDSLHRKIALTSETVWQAIFSREIFSILKVVVLDVFLQRRILQESVKRWAIHSLIYLAIVARLALSLVTYFAYRISPDSALAVALIDKNSPFTAFVYDFLGLLILVGLVWAALQRFVFRPVYVARESQDNIALCMIGLLILLGFFLEGARILMTGLPSDVAVYSFIGYPTARLLDLFQWKWIGVYQYLWYAHAILGAALVAYLPFGKMKHVFNTPLTLVLHHRSEPSQ